MRESTFLHRLPIPSLRSSHSLAMPWWYISITTTYLDSFQYAATSNFGRTRVAFSKRATPTPSQNCINCQQYQTGICKSQSEISNIHSHLFSSDWGHHSNPHGCIHYSLLEKLQDFNKKPMQLSAMIAN